MAAPPTPCALNPDFTHRLLVLSVELVSRMNSVNFTDRQRFWLRGLLQTVRGAVISLGVPKVWIGPKP